MIVDTTAEARPGVLELMDEGLARPDVAMCICSAATKEGFEKVVNNIVGPERLAKWVNQGVNNHKGELRGEQQGERRRGLSRTSTPLLALKNWTSVWTKGWTHGVKKRSEQR